MTLMTRAIARAYHLPRAETYHILVEKNLPVLLPDGVTLYADHFYSPDLPDRPTLLIRTAYGKDPAGFVGRLFAERGFQVVIQSARGTDESGGVFDPFRQEGEDGAATIAWLKTQPWFTGELVLSGASYLGYTQWALAAKAGATIKAYSTQTISADLHSMLYFGGPLALEMWIGWLSSIHTAKTPLQLVGLNRKIKKTVEQLPLIEIDQLSFDKKYSFWQQWLEHKDPTDPYWAKGDFRQEIGEIDAPNLMIDGWYDFFLPHELRDYRALVESGHSPYLLIGPWTHFDTSLQFTAIREGIAWLRGHLLGERNRLPESPVRVYLMGANKWMNFSTWPPEGSSSQNWYLQCTGNLANTPPPACPPDRYRYDPADPTPSVGGAGRTIGRGAGSQDNRALEARPDVLTYTTEALQKDLEIIGPVSAELFVRSSLEYTDFFVRVCDVFPDGKSMNVCDGILRLAPGQPAALADGCKKIRVELWPTAYQFKQGHRLRVQVSSGSFPRFARNLGAGEPIATATAMIPADQSIYHDPEHPSVIFLPVFTDR